MMKVRCVTKYRDKKGKITGYLLIFEDGYTVQATAMQIKNEIAAGRYEFTNLQIDRAGRLVDKAISDVYTIEDLIRNINPKGRKVRCYDAKNGKEYIGMGECLYTGGKMAHSSISVYIPKTGYEMTVHLEPTKDAEVFWKEYRGNFSLRPENQDTVNKAVDFCKQNKSQFGLRLVVEKNLQKVDCKPNPNGRYTVLAIGKSKGADLYKIRDHKEGIEYWDDGLGISTYSNDYTNVYIKRKQKVFDKNIQVVDITNILKKKEVCIEKIKKEIRKYIPDGITVTADEIHVKDFKTFDETCKKVQKLWDSLELKKSFRYMLFSAVEDIMEYEEHPQTLYYGYLGDGGAGNIMEETSYSYNPEYVRKSLEALIQDYMTCLEDCSEDEAKRAAYDLVRTNIQHDFYIDDDEEDDDWESDWD